MWIDDETEREIEDSAAARSAAEGRTVTFDEEAGALLWEGMDFVVASGDRFAKQPGAPAAPLSEFLGGLIRLALDQRKARA
jgi:hypothetical protein